MLGLVLLMAGLPGCSNGKPATDPVSEKAGLDEDNGRGGDKKPRFKFVERTSGSGIEGTYQNGADTQTRSMLETLGGGVGVVDFDLDGQIDCFFNGGGTISADQKIAGVQSYLYRNLKDWTFERCDHEAGIDTSSLYDHGCQWGDIDNDGFGDLVVTGYQGILVFRNLGDGSFEPIDCGIQTDRWATSAAFGDFNQDGNLDLYVGNYLDWSFANHRQCRAYDNQQDVCSPRFFEAVPDDLFTSGGDWTFVNDGAERGIHQGIGKSLGVVTGDIDLDGDVDIYVACDVTNNLLLVNQGDGTFQECGATSGVDTGDMSMPNGSMGTGITDFNQDGLPDIGVANYENEDFALYSQIRIGDGNQNSLMFSLASKKTRLTAIDQLYVSWGTLFEDFDADGDDDLIINNGHVEYFPKSGSVAQMPQIFENDAGVFRFKDVVDSNYFTARHFGRGLVAADFDNDGDLDLAFSNCNEPFAILENQTAVAGKMVRVQIIGTRMNRDGIGPILTRSGKAAVKLRVGGGSYLSSCDPATWLVLDPGETPATKNVEIFGWERSGHHLIGLESPSGAGF